jgi:hypothetical protein
LKELQRKAVTEKLMRITIRTEPVSLPNKSQPTPDLKNLPGFGHI